MRQVQEGHARGRQRERRRGIDHVLRATVAGMQAVGGRPVVEYFESALREAFDFADVKVAESWFASRRADAVSDAVGLSVSVPGTSEVIRSVTGEGQADAWCLQQLEALAAVAALALEVDRLRGWGRGRSGAVAVPVLVGSSAAMQAVRDRIDKVAPSVCPVLIQGESGAGKEVVARLIHERSRRVRGPFVAVNCAAIVESLLEAELFGIEDRTATGVRGRRGKFELAAGGTLFLDEIGDLASSAQAKLLRVLQDLTVERVGGRVPIPVDVRIVAATNRDLRRLVAEGRFRPDLYYRLNGVEIDVPPLRSRLGDLPALVDHVLARHGATNAIRLEPEAWAALRHHNWPGNVRELERVLERAMILSTDGVVRVEHLPPAITEGFQVVFAPALAAGDTLRAFVARYVRLVLARHGNNRAAASRALGISYHTLRAHLRRDELPVKWARRASVSATPGFEAGGRGIGLVADRDAPAAGDRR